MRRLPARHLVAPVVEAQRQQAEPPAAVRRLAEAVAPLERRVALLLPRRR